MTEIERIIQGGVISPDFLCPETICDFVVDEKRKKIWAIGIDLLVQFDSVCRRHGLQYSLGFGSLLGYVRHHGFIPWDDDIDVVMPREDYERLKKYKTEFKHPYFLQFPGEDQGYYFSIAKLRNSNTTSISWAFRYENFNQGIFLDIFPLDNFNKNNLEENFARIKKLIAESSALMRRSNPYPDETDKQKLAQFPLVRDGNHIMKELDEVLRIHNGILSDSYIAWCCSVYGYQRMIFPKSLLNDLIEVDFYGHQVFIPSDYNKVLKITYGDYKQFPPVEQRGAWHGKSIFEPDIPYQVSLQLLRKQDCRK